MEIMYHLTVAIFGNLTNFYARFAQHLCLAVYDTCRHQNSWTIHQSL